MSFLNIYVNIRVQLHNLHLQRFLNNKKILESLSMFLKIAAQAFEVGDFLKVLGLLSLL